MSVAVLLVVSVADLVTTWVALSQGMAELSPLGGPVLAAYGFGALVVLKAVAVVGVCGLAAVWRPGVLVVGGLAAITAGAVGWNVYGVSSL